VSEVANSGSGHWSSDPCGRLAIDNAGLIWGMQGDEIVVTLSGRSYVVTDYRAAAFPQQLLTKSHSGREDKNTPITQAEFHTRAWKAANDARKLGWIV